MSTNIRDYKHLIGLLLGPVRERPALFLGENKISKLPEFIVGYNMGYLMTRTPDTPAERYFDDPGFIEWFFEKHKIPRYGLWHQAFLEQAHGDEKKALDLFFTSLEEYAGSIQADPGK